MVRSVITIYGADWCGWCNKAKAVARQYGLDVDYKNVDDAATKQELVTRWQAATSAENKLTIPQIWWDDRYVGGYDKFSGEVENTLGNYGQGPC